MEFITYLLGEAKVIAEAPVAFVALVLVIGLMMYLAVRHQFADRLESMQARIQLKDDRIAAYEAKLQGKSPDEAAAVIEDLKRRLAALEPRSLSNDEAETLRAILSRQPSVVEIAHDGASAGTKKFYSQLAAAFQQSGWDVQSSMIIGLGNSPSTGIALVGDPNDPATQIAIEAFRRAGIQCDQQFAQRHGGDPPLQVIVTTPA
jgi:hypothetical protein